MWSYDCKGAFQELKIWITSTPILVVPHNTGTYVLDTDASDRALGAMLQQEQNRELCVIATQAEPCLMHSSTIALLARNCSE